MEATTPLSGPILTCPARRSISARRVMMAAGAILIHILVLASPWLVPLFVVEMMQPPKATVPVQFVPPGAQPAVGPRSQQAGRVRRGGGPQADRSASNQAPRVIPLEAPEPNPDGAQPLSNTPPGDALDGLPGAPPGPGLPDGDGTDATGSRDGCPGCYGAGPAGPAIRGPGETWYEWDAGITVPVPIQSSRVMPEYPEIARRANLDGTVILLAVIRPDGRVGAIEVLRAPNPRLGFEFAAIEAVKQWRYRPGLMHGRPVSVYVRILIEFTLSR
jgi:protein TonB